MNHRIPYIQSVIGGVAASIGLELFLHPHEMIAGGITGISALVSFHTENHFSLLLLLFNSPLLLLFAIFGRRPVLMKVLPGLLAFSSSALLLAPLPAVSSEPVIAALTGGICFGLGAGMAAKSGMPLDSLGLEKIGYLQPREVIFGRRILSAERLLLICHGAVLVAAGLMMGWERTMYSAIACLAAYEASALVLWGIRRSVWVAASDPEKVRMEVKQRICLDAEHVADKQAGGGQVPEYLLYKVHILDITRFKAVIKRTDPDAEMIWVKRCLSDR